MRTELLPRDTRDRLIVALDVANIEAARSLVAELGGAATFYKVGMQLAFGGGLSLIGELVAADKRVFLDMKLLDIDNTVAAAAERIADLGVTFTTIHAYPKAMRAAVGANPPRGPGLLAVTVLTSMDDAELRQAGYAMGTGELVAARAADARQAGMDGIVCSPQEVAEARRIVGDMAIVAPGIRPSGSAAGDQKRVMGPAGAIAAGADYIVVGRPVTQAQSPVQAATVMIAEIESAL